MKPDPSAKPVTLRDVAAALGVAGSTISRALKNNPRIPLARREQIQKAAKAMGYQPNAMAAALSHQRHHQHPPAFQSTLAWLNFWPNPDKLRALPLFDAMFVGAVEAADSLGYHLEEFQCGAGLSPRQLGRILKARGIRGLLLPPQRPPILPEEFAFDWESYAVIRIGRTILHPLAHVVTGSQAHDAMLAFRRIWNMGYRRIGLAMAETIHTYGLFDAGFLKAQAEVPRKNHVPALLFKELPGASPDVLKKIDAWMKQHRPDAILATEWNMKYLLNTAGYRVPEDVALAATSVKSCDTDAGILEDGEEIGRVAVKNLVGLLHRNEVGHPNALQDILVRGGWQNGNSLPDRTTRGG